MDLKERKQIAVDLKIKDEDIKQWVVDQYNKLRDGRAERQRRQADEKKNKGQSKRKKENMKKRWQNKWRQKDCVINQA